MKLSQPIALNVIRAMRGVVDFYYWKGIPVARKWPSKPRQPMTTKQRATLTKFPEMHNYLRSAPNSYKAQWALAPTAPGISTQDMMRKTILWLLYQDAMTPLPDVTRIRREYQYDTGLSRILVTCNDYASFVPENVHWRVQEYETPRPALSYNEVGNIVDRENFPTANYHPNVAPYREPSGQGWDADSSTYEIFVEGCSPYYAVAGFSKLITD